MGVGPKTDINIDQLTGYKLSSISSKSGTFEYFYLIDNNRKVVKLSTFYHKNYHDIKTAILRKRIKNLGTEDPSILRETIESLQW